MAGARGDDLAETIALIWQVLAEMLVMQRGSKVMLNLGSKGALE